MRNLYLKFQKIIITLLLVSATISLSIAQDSCYVSSRGTENGFDSYLTSFAPNTNCVNHTDFGGVAWTCNSAACFGRCVIQFYLPNIPTGYFYSSASIDLFSNPAPYSNGGQAAMYGTNECILRRITSPWNDNTVTWNNQPTTTTQNEVLLAQSSSSTQDYLNIDISNMVGDIYNDLSQNYGFMIMLTDETYYRNMIFASSDIADTSKHPRLNICFQSTSGVHEFSVNQIKLLMANYNKEIEITTVSGLNISNIKILSSDGRILNLGYQNIIQKDNNKATINIDLLARGVYFLNYSGVSRKFIKL